MSIEGYQSSKYTYHQALGRKHRVPGIILMLRAAANPFSPGSSQLLLVLSLICKVPLLYLRNVPFFNFRLDVRVLCRTRIRSRSVRSLLLLFSTAPTANIGPGWGELGRILESWHFNKLLVCRRFGKKKRLFKFERLRIRDQSL